MTISRLTKYQSSTARLLSLLIALSVSVGILAWPTLMVSADGRVNHWWLTLLMWGMAAGYVHGVGFIPRNRVLRVLFGPIVAWSVPLLVIVAMQLM
jgi:cyd operon protein YbgE